MDSRKSSLVSMSVNFWENCQVQSVTRVPLLLLGGGQAGLSRLSDRSLTEV